MENAELLGAVLKSTAIGLTRSKNSCAMTKVIPLWSITVSPFLGSSRTIASVWPGHAASTNRIRIEEAFFRRANSAWSFSVALSETSNSAVAFFASIAFRTFSNFSRTPRTMLEPHPAVEQDAFWGKQFSINLKSLASHPWQIIPMTVPSCLVYF